MIEAVSQVKDILKTGRFLIPYRIYENAGPQIICINGVQQSMAMWHSFVRRFSRDYRIVLFDFPNQGKAKITDGPVRVTLDEQVDILQAMVDKTGIGPEVTMCAASWGGVIAAAFAAKYPSRIKRLILASLSTKPNKKMVETIKAGSSLNINNREQMAQTLINSFGEDLPPLIKQRIISQFRTMDEENIRAFYEHGLFVISSKKLSDLVNLKNIKAKTILINGEKDTIIDLEDVTPLVSLIPDCEMRIIKGVGHFLHMEHESVMDIYADILSS
jgi:pimeloyl-ACP methyl ester carboxylesterase